jgi:UDP-N-acetyl-D-galactosamine dehydrogenase
MAGYVAEQVHARLASGSEVLVLGLTFKENVPDLRNSKVVDLVQRLVELGHHVSIFDPFADAAEARDLCGIELLAEPGSGYDCVVGAVAHRPFAKLSVGSLVKENGLVADIKGIWSDSAIPSGTQRWEL